MIEAYLGATRRDDEPAARSAELRAGYGPVNVLHELDLTVDDGEIVVVLGANGAGKTTTMRAISGTIPRAGHDHVRRHGRSSRRRADAIVRAGIAQVPQGRGTFPELSVDDNLRIGAYTRRDGGVGADIERWFDDVPPARRAQRPTRRQPVGRRAADAGHRPGPDEPAQAAAVRRAQPGLGAAHHPGDVRRSSTR